MLNANVNNCKHSTLDERMDQHDVYKVESISDSYLVASGLPKKNGDKLVTKVWVVKSFFVVP